MLDYLVHSKVRSDLQIVVEALNAALLAVPLTQPGLAALNNTPVMICWTSVGIQCRVFIVFVSSGHTRNSTTLSVALRLPMAIPTDTRFVNVAALWAALNCCENFESF